MEKKNKHERKEHMRVCNVIKRRLRVHQNGRTSSPEGFVSGFLRGFALPPAPRHSEKSVPKRFLWLSVYL
uniref:Uncharacterized protein n=1 Tax=Ixodes ricinus TaxID=34613 RepID=A0A6B0U1D0_IXORI